MQPQIGTPDGTSRRWRQGSMTRRLALATVGLFLAGLLGLAVVPAMSAPAGLPAVTGSLPRFGDDAAAALGFANGAALKAGTSTTTQGGVGVLYPKLDRLYQLYNLTAGPHAGGIALVERELATLKIGRTLVVPGHAAIMMNDGVGAEWLSTFDGEHDRLYLAYQAPGGLLGAAANASNAANPGSRLPGLLGIDLRTLSYSDSTFPDFLASTADAALVIVGLEYDESTDTLLALQEAVGTNQRVANALVLVGWSSESLLKGGTLPANQPRPVRACKRDPVNDSASPYMTPILVTSAPDADGRPRTWVTFPCYSTAYSSNVVIVRLDRQKALTEADPEDERVVVAPAGVLNWAQDRAHGRLFLVNESAETDAWVYEVASDAFVGILALSPRNTHEATSLGLGVDDASGRLYGRAPSYGLMISAAAQDPVPQADAYPRLGAGSAYRLLVDGRRNRLFSLTGSPVAGGTAAAYDVIEVPAPLPAPPADDPDSRTTQVAEAPGRTTALYGGSASAYGLRVLLSRGVSGAVPTNGNDALGRTLSDANSDCGFTDRQLVLARVAKTEFSNASRYARAAAVDVDSATAADLEHPSRCDAHVSPGSPYLSLLSPFLNLPGVLSPPASSALDEHVGKRTKWDYTPADCRTPDEEDEAGPNSAALAGPTSVACAKRDEVSATAESRLGGADGLDISVGRAVTSTKVALDKERGLVTTAASRLEHIRIGDITIGYLASSATSFAHGRAGSAGTEFPEPRIGFVDGPGVLSCDDHCDLDAVLASLNAALAGRAEFRRVAPQADLAAGSPGGYEAGILKSQKQQASDNSLSGDKSVEVPALELVVYNDSSSVGRARQVYQLAGVRADSHYGISLLGGGADCATCEPLPGAPVDAVTGQALPGAGAPLVGSVAPHVVSQEGLLHRFARQGVAGADYSLRLIFSHPRDAVVMATVWALLWAPFIAGRRRRALRLVTEADPEGLDG